MDNTQEVCGFNEIQSSNVQAIGIHSEQASYFVCFECNKSLDN
jgi:hypothetical protein